MNNREWLWVPSVVAICLTLSACSVSGAEPLPSEPSDSSVSNEDQGTFELDGPAEVEDDYFYSEGDYSSVVESLPTVSALADYLECEDSTTPPELHQFADQSLHCRADGRTIDLYGFSSEEQYTTFEGQLTARGIDEHRFIQSGMTLAIVPEDPFDLAAVSISLP